MQQNKIIKDGLTRSKLLFRNVAQERNLMRAFVAMSMLVLVRTLRSNPPRNVVTEWDATVRIKNDNSSNSSLHHEHTTTTTTTIVTAATTTATAAKCNNSSTANSAVVLHHQRQRPRPPKMILFVRMSGTHHQRRFFCTFFRSVALFWNVAFTNRIVLLLDDEVPTDHEFGTAVTQTLTSEFPEFDVQVKYEPLPQDVGILNHTGQTLKKSFGYRRQLYSSFITDQFIDDDDDKVDDTLIVFMDSDAMFFSPVTLSSILDEYNRPRVLGSDCTYTSYWVKEWAYSVNHILGFPMIADFMTYFPVYIYAGTIRNCRRYLLTRFGGQPSTTFEDIYPRMNPAMMSISPICVLLSYAWYFERERYSWSFEICEYLSDRNREIENPGHHICPDDVTETLPVPQTAFHQVYSINASVVSHVTYCLAQKYILDASISLANATSPPPTLPGQRSLPVDCLEDQHQQPPQQRLKYTLKDLYVLFMHNLQLWDHQDTEQVPPRCKDANEIDCISRLERHFQNYVHEVQQNGRPPLDWNRTVHVDDIAERDWDITCSSLLKPTRDFV